jgi:hypothetical protein
MRCAGDPLNLRPVEATAAAAVFGIGTIPSASLPNRFAHLTYSLA